MYLNRFYEAFWSYPKGTLPLFSIFIFFNVTRHIYTCAPFKDFFVPLHSPIPYLSFGNIYLPFSSQNQSPAKKGQALSCSAVCAISPSSTGSLKQKLWWEKNTSNASRASALVFLVSRFILKNCTSGPGRQLALTGKPGLPQGCCSCSKSPPRSSIRLQKKRQGER